MRLIYRSAALAAATLSLLVLAACDPQRISELKEGVSTEADVRDRFGAPENVWDEPCLLYTSPSPRDRQKSRMPSSA